MQVGAYKGQRHGMSKDLELKAVVKCLMWMLGMEASLSSEDPPRSNLNVKDLAKAC